MLDTASSFIDTGWPGPNGSPAGAQWSVPFPSVSVVIPALNEAANLPHVLPSIPYWVHEIVLVDGHSTDNTVEVAQQICPCIRVVQQKGKGKGSALRTGFAEATGEIIVMLDADGSTDPQSRIVAMSFCEPRSCRLQLSS